ncbi:MAG: RNA polymerase sigma factor, partial [Luteolibacter sp.]
RGDQPLSHWVSRICVTSCYEHLRKRKSRPLTYQSDLSDGEIALIEATTKDAHPADAQNSRQLLVETLQKLIDALKPREQIVIRLLDIEGRSVKEACELTGWSASKVKTTAMRARRKLSESIHRIENRPRKNS